MHDFQPKVVSFDAMNLGSFVADLEGRNAALECEFAAHSASQVGMGATKGCAQVWGGEPVVLSLPKLEDLQSVATENQLAVNLAPKNDYLALKLGKMDATQLGDYGMQASMHGSTIRVVCSKAKSFFLAVFAVFMMFLVCAGLCNLAAHGAGGILCHNDDEMHGGSLHASWNACDGLPTRCIEGGMEVPIVAWPPWGTKVSMDFLNPCYISMMSTSGARVVPVEKSNVLCERLLMELFAFVDAWSDRECHEHGACLCVACVAPAGVCLCPACQPAH